MDTTIKNTNPSESYNHLQPWARKAWPAFQCMTWTSYLNWARFPLRQWKEQTPPSCCETTGQRPRPAPARSKWGQVGLCHQSPDNFSYLVAPPPHCADNSSICLTQKAGSVWSTGGVSSLSPRSPTTAPDYSPLRTGTWWGLADWKTLDDWRVSELDEL